MGKWSEEAKARNKGRPKSVECRRKISATLTGRKRPAHEVASIIRSANKPGVQEKRLGHERRAVDHLRSLGFEVRHPKAAFDMVALKDGRVYLVEFKSVGSPLTPLQQKTKKEFGKKYLVLPYDLKSGPCFGELP